MSAIVALTAQNTSSGRRRARGAAGVRPGAARGRVRGHRRRRGQDRACYSAGRSSRRWRLPREEADVPLVVDPVMVAASGAKLLQDDAVSVLVERLFPLASVVTPNLHEACALRGRPIPTRTTRGRAGGGPSRAGRPGRHGHRRARVRAGGLALRRRAPRLRSPWSATGSGRRTGPAAPTRRAWPRSSPAGRPWRRLRAQRGGDRVGGGSRRARGIGAGSGPVDVFALEAARSSGEFGLLAELERRGLVRGLDAGGAVLAGGVVVTQDALVEGVHFRPRGRAGATSATRRRRSTSATSPRSAPSPRRFSSRSRFRTEVEVERSLELYEGMRDRGARARRRHRRAREVVLSVTAVGSSERVPGRAGARPGDVLVVTGPLGGAAAGLRCSGEGLDGFDELVAAHRRPPLRLEEGRRLARVAHALVDLSDGIAGDAARIAERSGCRLVVELRSDLPLAPRIERGRRRAVLDAGRGLRAARGAGAGGRRGARVSGRRPVRGGRRGRAAGRGEAGQRPAGTRSRVAATRPAEPAFPGGLVVVLELAPITVAAGSPPSNRITVGIERTL